MRGNNRGALHRGCYVQQMGRIFEFLCSARDTCRCSSVCWVPSLSQPWRISVSVSMHTRRMTLVVHEHGSVSPESPDAGDSPRPLAVIFWQVFNC